MQHIQRLFDIDPWCIATHTLDKENLRLMESITSLGNGYMGMRGNFEEGVSGGGEGAAGASHKGTYLAGVWYPDKTRVGWWKIGYPEYFGKVINAVDFISVGIEVNGKAVDLMTADFEDFSLRLDMKNGLLTRAFTYIDGGVKVRLTLRRFVSIVTRQACCQSVAAEVLASEADITLRPRLDGYVHNLDSNYGEIFWQPLSSGNLPVSHVAARTTENPYGVPRFTVTALMKNRLESDAPHTTEGTADNWRAEELFCMHLAAGQGCVLEKTSVVVTSRDVEPEGQLAAGEAILQQVAAAGFEANLAAQTKAWEARWQKADVRIEGDDAAQQGIRFNIFGLFQTYYGEDARLNIGPKGFTGEKYGGATYWDTEAFIVPMYLAVADSGVTQSLLRYRYNQLEPAVRNAQKLGLPGALYPMVTFTGDECHNEWEITFEEIHRNSSIAYAIYNYTNYTGDEGWVLGHGLAVLAQIARFWAGRVHFARDKGVYMIHGVTGPNEYENNVNNNWYTNYMAKWVLEYTLENLEKAGESRRAALGVDEAEQARWREVAEKLYLPYDEALGVFVQQDTFLDKDLRTTGTLSPGERPLNQHWSWDKILRSCFIKQADVLQGVYYFQDRFSKEEIARNFAFYEPMTVHESSLSPSVHSVLAARLGLEEKAVELYQRTARLDLDNYNNDTEDGLHITSMSGSWLAIVQGFGGMKVKNGTLCLAPFCPAGWRGYGFKVAFRGRLLQVWVNKEKATVTLQQGEALEIELLGETALLTPAESGAQAAQN